MAHQENTAAEKDQAPEGGFSTVYKNYALVLLLLGYTMNVVDRNIVNIVLQPLKMELHLSDTQLGFLTGLSFAFLYSTLGIPIAMLSDRKNRKTIIITALTIFSAATYVCGHAANFVQLLLARVVVAVGEAGTTPSSQSIISDLFPPKSRARAMGFYFLGINLGTLFGFLMGGWIAQWYGWRAAFMIVGLPGLILAVVMYFTLREPVRGHADNLVQQAKRNAPPFLHVVKYLWNQRAFRHLIIGIMLMSVGTYSITVWWPSFLMRSYGLSIGTVGTIFALMLGLVGGAGTLFSGWLADQTGKHDVRWNLWNISIVHLLNFPFCIAMYLAGSKFWTVLLFTFPTIAFAFYAAPTASMIQALVPVRMRAQASSIYFMIISLVGGGLGPYIAGVISDHLHPTYGEESLRYALLAMTIFYPWSVIHLLIAARTLREDIARARSLDAV